jgi:hypothetical protein
MGVLVMHTPVARSKYPFRTDDGNSAPSLGFAQSYWALTERESKMAESLEQACREGFAYLEVGLREDRLPELSSLLKRLPLSLIAQGWAADAADARTWFERAERFNALALNLHLGHAYLPEDEAAAMLDQVHALSDAFGIPVMLETHRGRLTQDLYRASSLIARRPETVIALDISHYLVAGETLGGSEQLFRQHIAPLLARTALIHGRVSNGQSIQVFSTDRFAYTELLQSLWQRAMEAWLEQAPAGAVLVFEPELGPPPYAFTDSAGRELSDRTEQSAPLVALARAAWEAAKQSHTAIESSTLNQNSDRTTTS